MRKPMQICGIVLALLSLATTGWQFSTARTVDEEATRQTSLATTVGDRPHLRFDELIHKYAGRYRVDPALVKAVIHAESGFRAGARSRRGARGLMQVMPRTGRVYGVRNLDDPESNLHAGVRYLRYLLDRHHNDPRLALAAYNAGSSVVTRYGDVPPYPETRRYVARVLRYRVQYVGQMKTAAADEAAARS
jgi:soluble lytic murein transglycosylase-like protein